MGAIDLRTPTDHVWMLGRAPSGAELDLFWWSGRGYAVPRCVADDQPI
jgi:hypothetical protein